MVYGLTVTTVQIISRQDIKHTYLINYSGSDDSTSKKICRLRNISDHFATLISTSWLRCNSADRLVRGGHDEGFSYCARLMTNATWELNCASGLERAGKSQKTLLQTVK
jgi:hypothetical protein